MKTLKVFIAEPGELLQPGTKIEITHEEQPLIITRDQFDRLIVQLNSSSPMEDKKPDQPFYKYASITNEPTREEIQKLLESKPDNPS